MQHSLLISDLHLCDSRPHITQAFVLFCQRTASKAERLYILGDLFEYWPGDDAIAIGFQQTAINAIKTLGDHGVTVFFMAGNRDFLLGEVFASLTNVTILSDPNSLNLYGYSVLLSHGDALCTDDIAYQTFRREVRNVDWQANFLSQPITARIAYIEQLRAQSTLEKSTKSMQIMDVNPEAVNQLLRNHHYPSLLIHGHTHRPNTHQITIDDHLTTRVVLGDWYEQGSYLRIDQTGFHSQWL
jgi:UDP-2,3-diacylglucosamine hydrolase